MPQPFCIRNLFARVARGADQSSRDTKNTKFAHSVGLCILKLENQRSGGGLEENQTSAFTAESENLTVVAGATMQWQSNVKKRPEIFFHLASFNIVADGMVSMTENRRTRLDQTSSSNSEINPTTAH